MKLQLQSSTKNWDGELFLIFIFKAEPPLMFIANSGFKINYRFFIPTEILPPS